MKKCISAGLVLVMLSAVLSACSGKDSNEGGTNASGEDQKLKISAMSIIYGAAPPENSSGVKAIEERYNIDYNFMPVVAGEYTNKLGVMLASGDIPDTVLFPGLDQAYFNAIDNEQFIPLESYLNDTATYPNFAKIPDELKKILTYNGHIYGVPRLRGIPGHTIIMRKDWLDKLGLEVPTTYDELYSVMKAFKEQDPDGNGKADTYGLALGMNDSGLIGANAVTSGMGGGSLPGTWVEDGQGGIIPMEFSPKAKTAYSYFAKLYQEGLVAKDFTIKKEQQVEDDFLLGKAGVYANGAYTYYTAARYEKARSVDPDFELVALPPLKNSDGSSGYLKFAGYFGVFAISDKAGKDEAKVARILKMLNDMIGDEGANFIRWGKEGVHYTEENGTKAVTDLGKIEGPGQYALTNAPSEGEWIYSSTDTDEIKKIKDISYKVALEGTPYLNQIEGLFSKTMAEKGGDLNKFISDGIAKIIMGQEPVDNVDNLYAEWKSRGGVQVIEEYTEAWKARQSGK